MAKQNEGYDYVDMFSATTDIAHTISAKELAEQIFALPRWVAFMMKLRNTAVKPFGLKVERSLSDLIEIKTEHLATITKSDRHLDFVVEMQTENVLNGVCRISMSTKVRFNNVAGRLYFGAIRPFHCLICQTQLKLAKQRLEKRYGMN